jgi:hypothetical protein
MTSSAMETLGKAPRLNGGGVLLGEELGASLEVRVCPLLK